MEKAMQEHGLGVWSGYFDNKVNVNGTDLKENPCGKPYESRKRKTGFILRTTVIAM